MAYSPIEKEAMARDLAAYVGMQIRLRRVEMKMTQDDLAELTGITKAQISKIERAETDMKLSTLAVLRSALALDVTVEGLRKPRKP